MWQPDPIIRDRLRIRLTPGEEELLEGLQFDIAGLSGDARKQSLKLACELARSLVARGGVPKARWRYFTDPELNIGTGRSRMQVLEAGSTYASDILLDPRFLPTLRYWVYGPELPPGVINWFMVAVAQHTDQAALRRLARQAVRDHDLPRDHACDEFFKLALEAGLDTEAAWSIRTAVHSMHTPARAKAQDQ